MTSRQLVGVVPVRRLLTAQPEQLVREVMLDHVVAIPDWATVLIASEYFATRRLLAFPVVNGRGELLGVVDVSLFTDEVIDLAKQTYDDIFQLIGIHGTAQRSTWMAFRDRFPWLLCNIAGGLIAAFIASRYEHLLRQVVVLALFIPIVLALAESVSMQALTLTMQNLPEGPDHLEAVGRGHLEGVPHRVADWSRLWRGGGRRGHGVAWRGARGLDHPHRHHAVDDHRVPARRRRCPPCCARPKRTRRSPPVPSCWPRRMWRRCCFTSGWGRVFSARPE